MTPSYSVEVDKDALAEAISVFEFVGGNSADALRVAINKAAPKAKTASSRAIRDDVQLSASYVNKNLSVVKATRAKLSGAIKATKRGLLMSRYSTDATVARATDNFQWLRPPPIPARGIRVAIKTGSAPVRAPALAGNKPFYMVLRGSRALGIAVRGAGNKVKVLSSPSVSQVFDDVRTRVLPAASAELQHQLIDAMRYLLRKQHPTEGLP